MTDLEINESLRQRGAAEHLQGIGRNGLIARWGRFVEKVEKGYALGLDDYCNELDLRELIESTGLGQDPEIQELDQRLKAQLQDTGRHIWVSEHPEAFWVRGYPRRLSAEMAKDLGL